VSIILLIVASIKRVLNKGLRGAKEFPIKMATSGWDLVGSKEHITTGFSGGSDALHGYTYKA